MGILDDAIRQHLELKRQHGAPEEELERQEEEALGPARREVAPADTAGGDGEVELEGAEDEAPEAAPATEAAGGETPATELEAEAEPEPHEQATILQEPESALDDAAAEPEAAAEPDAAPEPDAPPEPDSAAEPEPHPTAPYDAASDMPELDEEDDVPAHEALEPPAPAEDEAPAREAFDHADDEDDDLFADEEDDEPEAHEGGEETPEDVLEDTPDFLQETPEHDRLWFEQKPPRDFDFD